MRIHLLRKGADIATAEANELYHPPVSLLDGASLFLDLDGTLFDLEDRPDDVVADAALRDLLARLNEKLEGRLAVVSGRSLAQIDAILGPVARSIACSGSHGCEHRWHEISAQPHRPQTLDQAAERLRAFSDAHDGTLVEEKSFGVALHYRLNPAAEQPALKLAWDIARAFDLYLQAGKMMVELRVSGGDKGVAVRQMMRQFPMLGTHPLFVGDDRTDEPGFAVAAELGGAGIFVGRAGETAACYRLDDPAAVRAWLGAALA